MTLQLVYETHAITADNEAGIATGWLPGRLSARGRETAAELGQRRRDDGIDAVYVSDLGRAIDTVDIAFAGSPIPIVKEPRLRECNYGRLNGVGNEIHGPLRVEHVDVPWPEGESYRQVVDRTAELIRDVAARHDGGRVLFVSHSACKFALDHLLLGRDLTEVVAQGMDWQPGWEYVLGEVPGV